MHIYFELKDCSAHDTMKKHDEELKLKASFSLIENFCIFL